MIPEKETAARSIEELELATILFDCAQAAIRNQPHTRFYSWAIATPENRAGCLAIARHVLTYYAPKTDTP